MTYYSGEIMTGVGLCVVAATRVYMEAYMNDFLSVSACRNKFGHTKMAVMFNVLYNSINGDIET